MSYISNKPMIIHCVQKRAPLGPIGLIETSHIPTLWKGFFRSKRHAVYREHVSPSVSQSVPMPVTS